MKKNFKMSTDGQTLGIVGLRLRSQKSHMFDLHSFGGRGVGAMSGRGLLKIRIKQFPEQKNKAQ